MSKRHGSSIIEVSFLEEDGKGGLKRTGTTMVDAEHGNVNNHPDFPFGEILEVRCRRGAASTISFFAEGGENAATHVEEDLVRRKIPCAGGMFHYPSLGRGRVLVSGDTTVFKRLPITV